MPKEPIDTAVWQLRSEGVDEVTLVLQTNAFGAQDEKRQKSSALGTPEAEMTELHEDAMVPLLKSKGTFRKSAQSLQSLPLGSYMYLNHPNWKLTSLGALVLLPPRALKELDLRDNNLHDVGSALARFEALQELRISGSGGPSSPSPSSPSLLALPHLRRLRRPLLARHGGEELEFLPSPPLPQDRLFESSFACVCRKRGGPDLRSLY